MRGRDKLQDVVNFGGGAYKVFSWSEGYVPASTFACAWAMFPSSSIRYEMRRAYSSLTDSPAPYAMPMLRSESDSSGNVKPYFSAKRLLSLWVSKLQPRICAFFASYSDWRFRNPEPSRVQPGVSAFG